MMQLDLNKLFCRKTLVGASAEPMSFPFLISHAFDMGRGGVFRPDALIVLLARYCEAVGGEANPEHLRDLYARSLKASASEEGSLGLGKLPVDELSQGFHLVKITVPITGVRMDLRRYGDCLGIRPVDDRGDPHKKTMATFDQLADERPGLIQPFVHRYGFVITPSLKKRRGELVLNVQDEMLAMSRYLPDIKWQQSAGMSSTLGDDFLQGLKGIVVGSYGDAKVYLRITFTEVPNDATWRHGLISEFAGPEIVFRGHNNLWPQLEYFVRTADPDSSYAPALLDIEYLGEQVLLCDLAKMLYDGLYRRSFQWAVEHGNEYWIRFRRPAEKVAA